MKKCYTLAMTLLLCAGLAMIGLLSGCATTGTQTAADLQAQAAIACPLIQNALAQGSAIAGAAAATSPVYARLQTDIGKAQPAVTAVCAANASINATNLQTLAQTGLPAVADLIGLLNLPPAQSAKIQTDLVTAEVALNLAGVVESQIQAAQAAKTSAPAAASSAAK